MQFPGYWISGDASEVTIVPAVFDETELSEETGWKQSHQNVDNKLPHGFVQWEDALADIENRLTGKIACAPIRSDRDD